MLRCISCISIEKEIRKNCLTDAREIFQKIKGQKILQFYFRMTEFTFAMTSNYARLFRRAHTEATEKKKQCILNMYLIAI